MKMTGAESFVTHNFSKHDSTFNSCLHLIVYAYTLVEESKVYSRKEIQGLASTIRDKKSNVVELEDFLRNDLVKNFIEPHRSLFGLDYFIFVSGAEEFFRNIKVGILDIKVTSPLWNGDTYFIFECKRLNKTILNKYVTEGVTRFIKNLKYYPKNQNSIAGMISFLESKESKNRISSKDAYSEIKKVLFKYKKEILINGNLLKYKLVCERYKIIEDFENTFLSRHNRDSSAIPVEIYHIVLDYNHLIYN